MVTKLCLWRMYSAKREVELTVKLGVLLCQLCVLTCTYYYGGL